jgi:hypothetical protein
LLQSLIPRATLSGVSRQTTRAVALSSIYFAILAGVLLYNTVAPTQSVLSTPDAVLTKAGDLVDFTHSGAPGVMLLAKVHLQGEGKSTDGLYALAWAPGRFRRVFRFPNYAETDVMIDSTIYRQRSTEALPLLIWELQQLLDIGNSLRHDPKSRLHLLGNSADRTCVNRQTELFESRICVNSATGELRSIDQGTNTYDLSSLREHFEFSDYEPFAKIVFPRKLTFHGWDSRTIDVHIDKLLTVASLPADEFAAPAGAEREHYCEKPETRGELRPSTGNAIPIGLSDTEVDMYFRVSPIGGVRYGQVVYSNNPLKNEEILNWFIGTHFPVRTCIGEPVGYETIVTLRSGH